MDFKNVRSRRRCTLYPRVDPKDLEDIELPEVGLELDDETDEREISTVFGYMPITPKKVFKAAKQPSPTRKQTKPNPKAPVHPFPSLPKREIGARKRSSVEPKKVKRLSNSIESAVLKNEKTFKKKPLPGERVDAKAQNKNLPEERPKKWFPSPAPTLCTGKACIKKLNENSQLGRGPTASYLENLRKEIKCAEVLTRDQIMKKADPLKTEIREYENTRRKKDGTSVEAEVQLLYRHDLSKQDDSKQPNQRDEGTSRPELEGNLNLKLKYLRQTAVPNAHCNALNQEKKSEHMIEVYMPNVMNNSYLYGQVTGSVNELSSTFQKFVPNIKERLHQRDNGLNNVVEGCVCPAPSSEEACTSSSADGRRVVEKESSGCDCNVIQLPASEPEVQALIYR